MGRRRDSSVHLDEAAQDRRYVTALARGLDVLRCFRPQDRWLAHQEIARRTRLPLAGLARALLQYQRCGFVTSETEWEPEISAVGVPVDTGDGREPFGLTIGGTSARLQGAFLHEDLGPRLVDAGRAITAAFQAADWND